MATSGTKQAKCPVCGQSLSSSAAARVQRWERREKSRLRHEVESEFDARIHRYEIREERYRKEVELLKRQLDQQTAAERGHFNEEAVYKELTHSFPKDDVQWHGRGGDVLQVVKDRQGEPAGTIVYECKDTSRWLNAFLTQIKKAGKRHRTPYLVLVTSAFPRGTDSSFCVRDGVVAIRPSHVVALAEVMRRLVLETHYAGLHTDTGDDKARRLYRYITSTEFRQVVEDQVDVCRRLDEMLGNERDAHERMWAQRESLYREFREGTTALDTKIRDLIERRASTPSGRPRFAGRKRTRKR